MADVEEDVQLGEVALILGLVLVGGYFAYKFAQSLFNTCIANVGAIPGITGATQSQTCAAPIAAGTLKPGGKVIWSTNCSSDGYDYQQPCGQITIARRNPWNYINPWADVMTYKTISADTYRKCYPEASGVVSAPASAQGSPACCGGKQETCFCAAACIACGNGGGSGGGF